MPIENENEAYADLLCGHLEGFVWRLRRLPPEQWDYQFAPPAPSPRTLAVHAWQWLICDRQHIAEPDARLHQATGQQTALADDVPAVAVA